MYAVVYPHQRRRVTAKRVLKELESAKVLPVRVLNKSLHHRLVGLLVHMLQVVQSYHQPLLHR